MQTNYLSIIPVISKFEIPKGFGVIDKNVQNVATVHMLCTQPAERYNPMTSPVELSCSGRQALYAGIGMSSLFYVSLWVHL